MTMTIHSQIRMNSSTYGSRNLLKIDRQMQVTWRLAKCQIFSPRQIGCSFFMCRCVVNIYPPPFDNPSPIEIAAQYWFPSNGTFLSIDMFLFTLQNYGDDEKVTTLRDWHHYIINQSVLAALIIISNRRVISIHIHTLHVNRKNE